MCGNTRQLLKVGVLSCAVMALLALVLGGCQRQETLLPFETIEKERVEWYTGKEPKLVVVLSQEEVDSLSSDISPKAGEELSNVDFDEYFVVAVFQGEKMVYDYEAEVQRIVYQDSTISIYARFMEPAGPEFETRPLAVSPYHVVKVTKLQQLSGKSVEFVLIANGEEVVRETSAVP